MSGSGGPRRPLIAGNWKMHKTVGQARELVRAILAEPLPHDVETVVAPPFTALSAVAEELRGTRLYLGAQTMHEGDHGPYTGEIGAPMLVDLGVEYVILGHSERRLICGESDESVNRKVRTALAHGLVPIVAVGETAHEHAARLTHAKVVLQTRAAFAGIEPERVATCVVAYEPIWAIGTGAVDAPESANAVLGEIRGCVEGLADARLLYGGSMKPDNAAALLAQPNIDGGLIGGASLAASTFLPIVHAARMRTAV